MVEVFKRLDQKYLGYLHKTVHYFLTRTQILSNIIPEPNLRLPIIWDCGYHPQHQPVASFSSLIVVVRWLINCRELTSRAMTKTPLRTHLFNILRLFMAVKIVFCSKHIWWVHVKTPQ